MTEGGPAPADREEARGRTLELVAVVILSATTILTAWSAFQASKWGGEMSIAFSEASSSRIAAARADGSANVRTSNHIGLWTQWVAARGQGDEELAQFLVARFPEPLATAHDDWVDSGGPEPGGPGSPFELDSYTLPERGAAEAADRRADERFTVALADNQRSDNYTILTVLFAAVLFFTAMSGRVHAPRSQYVLLGTALVLGVVGLVLLVTFPKLV